MATYSSDRQFTDHIHTHLAVPKIYSNLSWKQVNLSEAAAVHIDMNDGIDYIFTDQSGIQKTVQERFRETKYQQYNDFTIRYRRDGNVHTERKASEYYKMKADFFTYGICNGSKADMAGCTDFIKFAVIDLRKVYEKIDSGFIIIEDNKGRTCQLAGDKIIAPIKYNTDGSSSFFPIDIAFLVKLWGSQIIVAQKGFL